MAFACVAVAAFSIGLVALAPWDLACSRYLFPRIEKRSGLAIRAGEVRPGLPFSLVLSEVSVRIASAKQPVTQEIERLRITPALSMLMARRGAAIEADIADGHLAIDWTNGAIKFDGHDLSLQKLGALTTLLPWKLGGRGSIEGELSFTEEKPPEGGARWTLEDATADGVGFPGFQLPALKLGRFEGELKVGGNRVDFSRGRASGGNCGLEISGGVAIAKPAAHSALNLHVVLTPTSGFLNEMGEKGRLLKAVQKPDGALRIAIQGTLEAPQTGLE